nr:nucleoside phosphorylase [Anaerolineae bacterium]
MPDLKLTSLHQGFGAQCKPTDIGRYVLVPGSQQRARQFASAMTQPREIGMHYEFLLLTGKIDGTPVTACSTGIGGRSTSIAVTELAELGGHTFLRVGVTGSLQSDVRVGDLIIAAGAVRMDKTSEHFIPIEYPAVAHFEVVAALVAAAQQNGFRYHVGVGATSSSFYCGEGTSGHNGYRHSAMDSIKSDLQAAGVYDWDTETATLFTLCGLYGLRAGRVNAVVDDPETGAYNPIGEANAVKTALDAVRILIAWDREKARRGNQYALPAYPEQPVP